MPRKTRSASLAVLALALLAPAGAGADAVRVGSDLSRPVTGYFTSYLSVQLKSATVPSGVSPSDGVITSWGVRTGALPQRYSIAVMHPKGDGTAGFTVTGFSSAPTLTAGTPDTTYIYPAPSVPILKGDFIGLASTDPGPDIPRVDTGNPGDVSGGYADMDHMLGDDLGPPSMNTSRQLLFNATVKFCKAPNVRGKKLNVARRLITAADCTPKVSRKMARKKKRRRVIRQKTAAGTTGVPGTTVEIVVGKKK